MNLRVRGLGRCRGHRAEIARETGQNWRTVKRYLSAEVSLSLAVARSGCSASSRCSAGRPPLQIASTTATAGGSSMSMVATASLLDGAAG
jgi:predicted transcriptional regulator